MDSEAQKTKAVLGNSATGLSIASLPTIVRRKLLCHKPSGNSGGSRWWAPTKRTTQVADLTCSSGTHWVGAPEGMAVPSILESRLGKFRFSPYAVVSSLRLQFSIQESMAMCGYQGLNCGQSSARCSGSVNTHQISQSKKCKIMANVNIFPALGQVKYIKINTAYLFYFFNVASRKFKITQMTHKFLDSAGLE